MAEVRKIRTRGDCPKVSVVIPSLDGIRNGNVELLLCDLEDQTEQDFEVIMSIGSKPNGHARNQGVRCALGRYLVCIDDDVRLGHSRVLEQLIWPFEQIPGIGMTGPAQLIPEDSSPFQRRAARETSRSMCPVVTEMTVSDFVSHMCLCMPTQLYKDVGWESDTLPRGTDPDLRRRVRDAGYSIVVVPHCWAYHPMPQTLLMLLKAMWRNGAGSAWVWRNAPDMCIDTPDEHVGEIRINPSVRYRALRFAVRFCGKALRLQYIGLSCEIIYALGYAYGLLKCAG